MVASLILFMRVAMLEPISLSNEDDEVLTTLINQF